MISKIIHKTMNYGRKYFEKYMHSEYKSFLFSHPFSVKASYELEQGTFFSRHTH